MQNKRTDKFLNNNKNILRSYTYLDDSYNNSIRSRELRKLILFCKSLLQLNYDYILIDHYLIESLNNYFAISIEKNDLDHLNNFSLILKKICNFRCATIIDEKIKLLQYKNKIDGFTLQELKPILNNQQIKKIRSIFKSKDNLLYSKYGRNIEREFTRHIRIYYGLNINKASNVLDLGAGFTYFQTIAKNAGQFCYSVDLPVSKNKAVYTESSLPNFYLKIYSVLGNSVEGIEIKKNVKLNLSTKKKFGAILCSQICFNQHRKDDLWTLNDWMFFLNDIYRNYLSVGGLLYLGFNLDNAIKKPFLGYTDLDNFFSKYVYDKNIEGGEKFHNVIITFNDLESIFIKDKVS